MAREKKGKRLQWHPPFYAGMQIEFMEEAGNLIFEIEHQLSSKPLEVDILIIKKDAGIAIRKEIGRIFRRYNIVEYKSAGDYLGIDDFYKVYAYACLYKSLAPHEDEIRTSEMTITFITRRHPYKLIKYLEKRRNYRLVKSGDGIYHITGDEFAMQLIVTSRISKEGNLWLWSMCNPVNDRETVRRLISDYEKNRNNSFYEAVMEMIVRTNRKIFRSEDDDMCEALEEIIEEKVTARVEKIRDKVEAEVRARSILELLEDYGEIPENLMGRVMAEKDAAVLKCWHKAAARAHSLDEFAGAM